MAMSNQYTLYHLHSDLSNGVTNIDSVTKYGEYIERAKECGMKAMAFTEHGSVFEWWHKKSAIEAAGMKYIHGIEAYLTLNIDEKIRDNYHCVLLAKNYDGFLELNSLVSKSFCRTDNHFTTSHESRSTNCLRHLTTLSSLRLVSVAFLEKVTNRFSSIIWIFLNEISTAVF